jgi:hypothetical protein
MDDDADELACFQELIEVIELFALAAKVATHLLSTGGLRPFPHGKEPKPRACSEPS